MEYIKTVETINFRLVFDSPEHNKPLPDSKVPVSVKVYGNSEEGLKFCASKEALDMVHPLVSKKPLPQLIRGYELSLPMAKHMGYLDTPAVIKAMEKRTATVSVASPPPVYVGNPFNSVGVSAPVAAGAPTSTAEAMAQPILNTTDKPERPPLVNRRSSKMDPANKI